MSIGSIRLRLSVSSTDLSIAVSGSQGPPRCAAEQAFRRSARRRARNKYTHPAALGQGARRVSMVSAHLAPNRYAYRGLGAGRPSYLVYIDGGRRDYSLRPPSIYVGPTLLPDLVRLDPVHTGIVLGIELLHVRVYRRLLIHNPEVTETLFLCLFAKQGL